jgi:ubiquinone/menaquinone biosynthesis C-methylase UbiE
MSSYLNTVAQSGQVNTPPGSYQTVREWALQSFVGPHSHVLEIGCSTGFISIEMARYTGASVIGVDLHADSIQAAKANVDTCVESHVEFKVANAGELPFDDDTFSHVVISGHLPFVSHELRRDHLMEALRVLRPWGHLLVALYYYETPPPADLVTRFNNRIGTQLSLDGNRAYWNDLFGGLPATLEYEQDYDVLPGDEERVATYIAQMKEETRPDWEEVLALFNENGRHLSYFVQVYRKVPNQKGLMLQIPRGGIYEVRKK